VKKLLFILLFLLSGNLSAQVTGLSEWSVFIDPGHSQTGNMGIYNYSEAEKVLRIALYLQELLGTKTDIGDVFLSRYDDNVEVGLSERTAIANSLDTDWYHSIHSDAGSSSANSTLLLHGGWRSNGVTVEKSPAGGKRMSDIMVDILTRAMRTSTRGNYADRTFYQGFPDNHTNQYPYLSVNRGSNMASELSEGGFHTNPMQNQLNMNADWKKIEAYAIFWTFLEYHNLSRPEVDIVTGIIRNIESSVPVNGAVVSINDKSYITDTYESLFYKYSSDPEQLANGFYYLDELTQASVEISVEADGYYPQSKTISVSDTFFTFADFDLISSVAPFVKSSSPVQADSSVLKYDEIVVNFNRPMNTTSVEDNFVIFPETNGTLNWSNDRQSVTYETELDFNTEYMVTISALAEDDYEHNLDGNGDGIAGDNFVLTFKTGQDSKPPQIISTYPLSGFQESELRPIISFEFDELIDPVSLVEDPVDLINQTSQEYVAGSFKNYTVNDKTVFNFFPNQNLKSFNNYKSQIQSGLSDIHGNEMATIKVTNFETSNIDFEITEIDNFNGSFTSYWWQPSQSGSTAGIKAGTLLLTNTSILNLLTESTKSMQLNYEWNLGSSSWLLREYLSGGSARDKTFDTDYKLQVYIFGDGSNTKFRFALDEGNGSSWPNHEVSKWFTIDWIGWRLVEWDLSDPSMVGSWLGNSILDYSDYRIDSFQLTYDNSAKNGTIYFDDLRIVKDTEVVGIENVDISLPQNYHLDQNYPNPFNPTTKIEYSIPNPGQVMIDVFNYLGQRIAVLQNGFQTAGNHSLIFDGSGLAAGTYTIRMRINNKSFVRKMTLLK